MTSTIRGLTVFFFVGVVKDGVRRGAFIVAERLILLVATLKDYWLIWSTYWGDSPVDGRFNFILVLGTFPINPDKVIIGVFFLLVRDMFPLILLFNGVITLGDCEIAGRLTSRPELIEVFVLLKFLRCKFWGLILIYVKSISPIFKVNFLLFDGFLS